MQCLANKHNWYSQFTITSHYTTIMNHNKVTRILHDKAKTRFRKKYHKPFIANLSWEKISKKMLQRNFIEKVSYRKKILISKVYRDLSFCEKFKFSKKHHFSIKLFENLMISKNIVQRMISKILFRKDWVWTTFIENISFSISLSKIAIILKFLEKILVQESNRIFWSYTYVSLAKNFSNDSGLSPR